MENYQSIIEEEKPDIKVLDGHLVDVQGTLIQGNALNESLYAAMLEAHEKGDNVFIYSSMARPAKLQQLGIDVEKFKVIAKGYFQDNPFSEESSYTVVTGQVIDDNSLEDQALNIILTDEKNGYQKPFAKEYSFTKTPISGKLRDYVRQQAEQQLKQKQRAKMRATPASPEEEREKNFRFAEDRLERQRSSEAYSEELRKNPATTKTREDFMMPLSSEDKARLHLSLRVEELKQKNKSATDERPPLRARKPANRPKIFLSPAEVLALTNNKSDAMLLWAKTSGRED